MSNVKLEKRWVISPKKSNDIIEQVLTNRGVAQADWPKFLDPKFDDLADPFKIKDMAKAVERINQAIKSDQVVGVFGDYDADGIPAAALLYEALTICGAKVAVYIPSRERGYGLSSEGIDYLTSLGVKLIIAVDLGITARLEIAQAKKRGIDIIVVDHHIVQKGKLPSQAAAVVNPKQEGDRSSFKDYAACGLAYKLVMALAQKTDQISTTKLKWLLDLPTISTVGDMVPLLGENRVITKFGLIVLQKTRRIGLQKLYEKAGIDRSSIIASTVSFAIAPRLNSPGRMEQPGLPLSHVSPAFKLLVTQDERQADALAGEVDKLNRDRQAVLDKVFHEALEQIDKQKLHDRKLIMVVGEQWPAGVVGLVAGKVMEQFSRPTIVLRKEEKIVKGSARSIEAFNIMEAFDQVKHRLLKHGGHPRAAGLSMAYEHLEAVYAKLLAFADQKLTDEDLVPKLKVDAVMSFDKLNLPLYRRLKTLEPHGVANPKPVLLIESLVVKEARTVGNGDKHLKLWLGQNGGAISAIGFDLGFFNGTVKAGDMVDVVGYLNQDSWNGRSRLHLQVVDIRKKV